MLHVLRRLVSAAHEIEREKDRHMTSRFFTLVIRSRDYCSVDPTRVFCDGVSHAFFSFGRRLLSGDVPCDGRSDSLNDVRAAYICDHAQPTATV